MINKVNMFEEMNKMKNLIHAKSGVVISEQANADADAGTIMTELDKFNSNESIIVDIIKKYKDIASFKNLRDRYKAISGKEFGEAVGKSIQQFNDKKEWNDLKSHLLTMGITLDTARDKNGVSTGSSAMLFTGGATQQVGAATSRQQSITTNYCAVKDGKIRQSNGAIFDWNTYASSYKVTEAEIAEAAKTCPNVVLPPANGTPAAAAAAAAGPTPTQRFATTATSLGIQNPKMDVATLQTILNTLNQGGSGLTESKNLVNEELNKMKYMLGYQRGRVISEQDAAQPQPAATQPAATQQAQPAATQQATPQQLIQQIQTVLKTKYNANLGNFGPNKDGIDSKWGNLTQTALDNALKSASDLKQKRATETQQTNTQDTAIQQAAETGRMAIPQTNNLPTQSGIQQRPQVTGVQTK